MDALQQRLLSGKESSTSFGSWPCRCSRRREGRQRYEQCQALPSLGKDRPAALLQAPIPATSISSAQQPSPPPVGFLRPVARNRVSEPFPLLPLHQHATDASKAPSDSPTRSTSYKPLRASAPLITKRIKQTRTWYELEALVAEENRNFNHVHASAALLHLTKLLQGLAGGSAGHFPHSKSNDGSSMYSPSFSEATAGSRSTSTDLSLGDSHAQSLHTFVDTNSSQQQQQQQQQRQILNPPPSEQQRQQQLQQQQQQQQETLLHGPPSPVSRSSRPTTSVDLAQQPPRVLALLHTLLRIVRREMPAMDVQGVSNTLYSLAVLRWPDMSLVEELMAAVQYRLDMSKPQNLANIIWSCVVLGYMPEQDWMVMYYRALDIRLHAFGPVDVSNTLWAFGRLQFDGKQYRVAPNVVRKLLQQAYSVLPHLEPQHMANTLWGLARLGFVPGPMWSQAFLNATGPKLLAMHAHELSSLAWAVGKLRMAPGPVWVSQLLLASQPMLHRMQPHQLSQLLLGLASLNARPPPQWMAAALGASQQHTSYYSPTALLQVLRGVGQLGGPSAAGFPSDTAEQWLTQHLQATSAFIGGGVPAGSATSSHSPSNTQDLSPAAAERNGYVDGSNGTGSEKSAADVKTYPGKNNHPSDSSSSSSATARWTTDNSSTDTLPSKAALSESEDAHEGGHPAAATSSYQAEELAQLLYALARMRARPPGWWLGQVLQAFQHTPGKIQALSRDGPATAMTVWSLRQLLPGSLAPTHTAAAADIPSAMASSSSRSSSSTHTAAAADTTLVMANNSTSSSSSSSSNSRDGHASAMATQHPSPEPNASPASQQQEPYPPSGLQQQQQFGRDQTLQSPGADGGTAAAFRHHLQPFLTALFEATRPRLQKPTYTAMELATLLHALASWGVTPPSAWMVRFWWRSLVLLSNTRKASSSSGGSKGNKGTRASTHATAFASKGNSTVTTPSGVPPPKPSAAPMHAANVNNTAFPGAIPASPGYDNGGGSGYNRDRHTVFAPTQSRSASSIGSTSDTNAGAGVLSDGSIRPLGSSVRSSSSSSSSSSNLSSGEKAVLGTSSNSTGTRGSGSSMGEGVVVSGGSGGSSIGSGGSQKGIMNPWALDMMLKALVKLRARPQEQWSRALLQASRMLLPHFAPHQFGSVLSSLAALGIKPGQGWQRSCLLASYRVWSRFTPSDWVSMLCGLARLEVKVPSDWLSCFFSSSTHHLASYSIRELAVLGTALCWLGARFPPTWSTAFLAAALPKLPHANPADLLRLVTSAIHLLPELTPLSAASWPPPNTSTSSTPAKLDTAQLTLEPGSSPKVSSTATELPQVGSTATIPPNELRRHWLAWVVATARSHVAARTLRGKQQRLLARALRQMGRVSQRAAPQEGNKTKRRGYVAHRGGQARTWRASTANTVKGRAIGRFNKGQMDRKAQDSPGNGNVDQNSAAGNCGSIDGGSDVGGTQYGGDVETGGQAV